MGGPGWTKNGMCRRTRIYRKHVTNDQNPEEQREKQKIFSVASTLIKEEAVPTQLPTFPMFGLGSSSPSSSYKSFIFIFVTIILFIVHNNNVHFFVESFPTTTTTVGSQKISIPIHQKKIQKTDENSITTSSETPLPLFSSVNHANVYDSRNDAWIRLRSDSANNCVSASLQMQPTTANKISTLLILPTNSFFQLFSTLLKNLKSIIQKSWYLFPLFIALIPVHSILILKEQPQMPSWWALQHISRDTTKYLIGIFLASNIAYILSGSYLLFPHVFIRPSRRRLFLSDTSDKQKENYDITSTTKDTISLKEYPPMLGISLLVCGTISIIYHAFQTMGLTNTAEGLSYVDHGFALTSGLTFLRKCGIPSMKTMMCGFTGLFFLSNNFMYVELHSIWHILSAVAAISWADDYRHGKKLKDDVAAR